MNTALDYAEINEGKYYKLELSLPQNFAAKGTHFDTENRNVRFECNAVNICNSEKIFVEDRKIIVKEQALVDAYFRCKHKDTINDCTIYIGESPAQLETEILSFNKPEMGSLGTISFEIKNAGGKFLQYNPTYTAEVFIKRNTTRGEELSLRDSITKEIDVLEPGESVTVGWQFSAGSSGKYILKITADAEDAGRAFAEQEFEIAQGPTTCRTYELGKTFLDQGMCKTEYLCIGCEYGYECKLAWEKNGILEEEIAESYPEKIYVQVLPINGSCFAPKEPEPNYTEPVDEPYNPPMTVLSEDSITNGTLTQ